MKIGLVPIAAKPYHAGHHCLVTIAAAENDLVQVFVSLSDRRRSGEMPILGSDMQRVWSEHLEQIMPGNVEIIYGGSPVRKVYEAIEVAEKSGSPDTYTVYSDPEDTQSNFPLKYRESYFPRKYALGQVVFAAEENPNKFTRGCVQGTPDISGTMMRASLASGDFQTFAAGLPPGVDAQQVFDILRSHQVSENLLRSVIRSIL